MRHRLLVVIYSLHTAVGLWSKSGEEGWLEDHNYYRCLHQAEPVKWSSDLARKAKRHADSLNAKYQIEQSLSAVEHSNSFLTSPPSGESIAFGKGRPPAGCGTGSSQYDQHCAVHAWWAEYDEYFKGLTDWTTRTNYLKIGHFAALVWKGVNQIGCSQSGSFYVCEYGSTRCPGKAADCMDPPLPGYNVAKCNSKKGMCISDADMSKKDACAAVAEGGGKSYAVSHGQKVIISGSSMLHVSIFQNRRLGSGELMGVALKSNSNQVSMPLLHLTILVIWFLTHLLLACI